MDPIDSEQVFLRAALADLPEFLLSNANSWPLTPLKEDRPVSIPFQLTIGNILLAERKIKAYPVLFEGDSGSAAMTAELDNLRSRWKSNFIRKIDLEYPGRIHLWEGYLNELGSDRGAHSSGYAFHVRNRVILSLFEKEDGLEKVKHKERLVSLDVKLKRISKPGSFIWDPALEAGFPVTEFWFLYRIV